jgi:hypothetical protein
MRLYEVYELDYELKKQHCWYKAIYLIHKVDINYTRLYENSVAGM